MLEACRTPVGKQRGALSGVRPDDLAALVLKSALERAAARGNGTFEALAAGLDEVFLGCANQAGEDNRNVARMSSLLAGLPDAVPGVTVNRLCASGLEAVVQAARAIRSCFSRRSVETAQSTAPVAIRRSRSCSYEESCREHTGVKSPG